MNTVLQSNPPLARPTEGRKTAIAVNIEIAGLLLIPPAYEIMENMVRLDIRRALDARNLVAIGELDPANDFKPRCTAYLIAGPNSFYGMWIVSDFREALLTVEEELKRTGLFVHAEIGWLCPDEMCWRRFQPKIAANPFTPKILDSIEKRLVNTKLLHTLAWFLQFHPAPPPP